jgi:hypothetical protein
VAARAGHTSLSFTLDRYGHLYPESDAALRDRLDAIYSAGERDQGAAVTVLTSMALLTGERVTRGRPPPSTFRGLLLSEPRLCLPVGG